MITDMNSYTLQLVHVQEFACLRDLEERRDLVLWVLEQEYPTATVEERFLAMVAALPIELETVNFGGCSKTLQLSLDCPVCGIILAENWSLHCQSDGQ